MSRSMSLSGFAFVSWTVKDFAEACVAQDTVKPPVATYVNDTHVVISRDYYENFGLPQQSIPIWFPIMIAFLVLAAALVCLWQLMHPWMHKKKLKKQEMEEMKKQGFQQIFGLMVSSTAAAAVAQDMFKENDKQRLNKNVKGWESTFA